jgi:hypothetical protein
MEVNQKEGQKADRGTVDKRKLIKNKNWKKR